MPKIRPDRLSETGERGGLDRWIFVGMGWFILLALIGFIPDSIVKVE